MTDTAETAPDLSQEPSVESQVTITPEADSDFSFVLDKYRADGRTDQDAAFEQAKAYSELQKKFGSFTGAPEEYEFKVDDAIAEVINPDELKEDPVFREYQEVAKEMGINNEGFNQLAELYIKGQMADVEAAELTRQEEMKALGDNAQRRIENIQDWAKSNLDAEDQQGLFDSLTSAAAVKAVENLIGKTKNAPQATDTAPAPSIDKGKLREMMVAKDEFGNPKMNDPSYKKQVNELYARVYGSDPQSVTIGG